MLDIRNLSIVCQSKGALVDGLNISVGVGEILAIVGRSGAGKSSLLNVIAGFIGQNGLRGAKSPWHWFDDAAELSYTGSVIVDGASIDDLPVEQRRKIGMVMQGGVVYEHLSILKNVMLPLRAAGMRDRNARTDKALELLRSAKLFADYSADAFEDELRKPASTLSGGEKQRVALARALAKKPSVFLLDEAFANLDPLLRAELFHQFTELIVDQQRCALVVTHDLSDLKHAQRVLLLGHPDEAAGYCSYRRGNDNRYAVEERRSDGNGYWQSWEERILEAA